MAKKKYDLITDLYAETVKEVTASPENWDSEGSHSQSGKLAVFPALCLPEFPSAF